MYSWSTLKYHQSIAETWKKEDICVFNLPQNPISLCFRIPAPSLDRHFIYVCRIYNCTTELLLQKVYFWYGYGTITKIGPLYKQAVTWQNWIDFRFLYYKFKSKTHLWSFLFKMEEISCIAFRHLELFALLWEEF